MNEDALQAGHRRRGVDVGPWDVSETGWQALDLLDFGGLQIPRENARKVHLNRMRSSAEYAEVVLIRDTTAGLQLQAFRSAGEPGWEEARVQLEADVRARGGEAGSWSGRAGIELQAVIPVVGNAHGRDSATVRFIGCDGPGWLLRGVVTGDVALPGSRDDWAYSCFEKVVVDPSFGDASAVPGTHAPAVPPEQGPVIPLRMPGPGRQ
ncbi:DUF3710 domain-containing protein [Streptomyces sp. WM4235]|uniref:DUF3710 domain-containing protein n=1 Tax=Streptomyces sp. WM4235 TaxID=1415551 RepID=UPI0006AFCF6A|nr:DUF3710 domain-containing protein [Streptomyces sp. WM4235]